MLLLLLNYVVLSALWKIDVYLISTLVNKSLYYHLLLFIIIIIVITSQQYWKRITPSRPKFTVIVLYAYQQAGPVFITLFRIRIKIRLKLNILLQRTFFETYFYYVTIDCWCLIHYLLQTRLLGILSFFVKEKVNFKVETAMKIWAH